MGSGIAKKVADKRNAKGDNLFRIWEKEKINKIDKAIKLLFTIIT